MSVAAPPKAHNRRSPKPPRLDPLPLLMSMGGVDERSNPCVDEERFVDLLIFVETNMISKRLRIAVKNSLLRQYRLAQAIGVDHSTLSAWFGQISLRWVQRHGRNRQPRGLESRHHQRQQRPWIMYGDALALWRGHDFVLA